ncbi:MAG: hypothetical protein VXW87_00240 [Pseudomonadota bacterium]|nr:hypothetical protein [Pseudomonadota bacterium]
MTVQRQQWAVKKNHQAHHTMMINWEFEKLKYIRKIDVGLTQNSTPWKNTLTTVLHHQ